jgi:acyl-CoA reductase-like NAD-dependent aldehyde dehydrogenase
MEWLIARGERALRPETRSNPLVLSYKKSQVHYEPLGVVAAIVSWNYRQLSFLVLSLALKNFGPSQHCITRGHLFWHLSL